MGKSVNRLGPTGSCGAWGPPHLPTLPWTQGSAAPLQGWPAGPKWHNTATGVTWSTQPVTTNLCPPSSPCRWDTSQVFLWYYFVNGVKIVNWLNKWFKQSFQSGSFSYFFMLLVCDEDTCSLYININAFEWVFSVVPIQGGCSACHTLSGGWVE